METPHLLAALPFVSPSNSARAGTVLLLSDATLQIAPSPELRLELEDFGRRVDTLALKVGSTLLVGAAAVGAALYTTRLRPLAWFFLGLSGGAGLVARKARRTASDWAHRLLAPHPVERVQIILEEGGLRFDIAVEGGPLLRGAFRLEPGEFAPFEAAEFLAAWEGVSSARSLTRKQENGNPR